MDPAKGGAVPEGWCATLVWKTNYYEILLKLVYLLMEVTEEDVVQTSKYTVGAVSQNLHTEQSL